MFKLTKIYLALKTTASSDSSRRTHGSVSIQSGRQPHKSPWSNYASSSHLDTNFVHRLFSERIDIFNSQVEFSKNSVFSGIIKITLKTFLECVRLQTFSKYGLVSVKFYIYEYKYSFPVQQIRTCMFKITATNPGRYTFSSAELVEVCF